MCECVCVCECVSECVCVCVCVCVSVCVSMYVHVHINMCRACAHVCLTAFTSRHRRDRVSLSSGQRRQRRHTTIRRLLLQCDRGVRRHLLPFPLPPGKGGGRPTFSHPFHLAVGVVQVLYRCCRCERSKLKQLLDCN